MAARREASEREVSELQAKVKETAMHEAWEQEREMLAREKALLTQELTKAQKRKLKKVEVRKCAA
mgnify:CR=1 FL=1|eukprot:4762492-Pyramimonas_sp.AAC.1